MSESRERKPEWESAWRPADETPSEALARKAREERKAMLDMWEAHDAPLLC